MKKLLFVCLGNICRSPAAEAIMQKMLKEANLDKEVWCDSAGTADYHVGDLADSRMRQKAKERGYDIQSRGRQFNSKKDFQEFDCIFTMDSSNYRNIIEQAQSQGQKNRVYLFTRLCKNYSIQDVPDPYYGGEEGFSQVIDILEDACSSVLKQIQEKKL